jgi:hypothetical protein
VKSGRVINVVEVWRLTAQLFSVLSIATVATVVVLASDWVHAVIGVSVGAAILSVGVGIGQRENESRRSRLEPAPILVADHDLPEVKPVWHSVVQRGLAFAAFTSVVSWLTLQDGGQVTLFVGYVVSMPIGASVQYRLLLARQQSVGGTLWFSTKVAWRMRSRVSYVTSVR